MDRNYVPLRSAGPPPQEAKPPPAVAPVKRRRVGVTMACNDCRRKKIRCDGQRPICANCQGNSTPCEYRDREGMTKESSDLVLRMVSLLNQIPSAGVVPLLRELASETDATTVMTALKAVQRTGVDIDMDSGGESSATLPEAVSVVNQGDELSTLYPAVYPLLLKSERGPFETERSLKLINTMHRSSSEHSSESPFNHSPGDPSKLCDYRLYELDIAQWTDVDISSQLAARCISLYLKTDHPLLGPFDPDLFVSDLVSDNTNFCSSLLVNALLYWGCQMYSAIDPQTDGLTLPFCAEAEELWAEERNHGHDTTLNMAAAMFLCLGYLGQGRDHSVLKYLAEVTEMGSRMGFFGTGSKPTNDTVEAEADTTVEIHAAWGVFNWTVLMSLFYHQPGMTLPSSPPRKDMPTRTPTPPSSAPYMGSTFPYLCRFWKIVHGVGRLYQEEDPLPWGSKTSLAFCEFKYQELLAWSRSLPSQLGSQKGSPHHVQIAHIWFHAAVLDIFRPVIRDQSLKEQQLSTFSDERYTAQLVCQRSTIQLKRLVVDYRLNYASSTFSILWHTALIYVANTILDDDHDENWYSYMLFCFYGYERLSKSWRVARAISKGLLSMALRKGQITSEVARRLLKDLERNDTQDMSKDIRASFMLDLGGERGGSASTAEHLANSFEANADIQDYTNLFEENE